MKKILGISAFYHDAAACLLIDGEIIAAVQEERFTREKHTPEFPVQSIKYCLQESGLEIDELDAVIFYDKPLLKFERILETYYAFAPKGIMSFLKAIPIWLNSKLFLKKVIKDNLKQIAKYDSKKLNLLFSEHHLSHAASAFFSSNFKKSAILTIDGVGEWSTASIGIGDNNKIKFLKELHFPHSLGLLYSSFTYFLGFKVNSGEYKLMGLAPYGDPNSKDINHFISIIKKHLIHIYDDGSVWLNQKYFKYSYGLKMINEKKWEKIFDLKKRKPEEKIDQTHCNLALAIQKVTEEIVIKMAYHAKKITGSENLCLSGGVALNCVANGKILKENIFKNIYIQPASGDAGGALGAAQAAYYIHFDKKNIKKNDSYDIMKGSYLGPSFSSKEIISTNKKTKANCKKYDDFSQICEIIAKNISEGKVIGWFQGRMEFGPRALGNRSILADPRNMEMQKKLNLKIKYREGFRPFAPSVIFEDVSKFFDISEKSPYMLIVANILDSIKSQLPKDYHKLSLWDKLYFKRSNLQSITHLDYSARIQTVHKETNPRYWELINTFKKITGVGVLVNTSFNVRGEPIVCNPYDAYRCFMSTDMDILVINDFVYFKEEQVDWKNKSKWLVNFKAD